MQLQHRAREGWINTKANHHSINYLYFLLNIDIAIPLHEWLLVHLRGGLCRLRRRWLWCSISCVWVRRRTTRRRLTRTITTVSKTCAAILWRCACSCLGLRHYSKHNDRPFIVSADERSRETKNLRSLYASCECASETLRCSKRTARS